jgi:hypothetical protein
MAMSLTIEVADNSSALNIGTYYGFSSEFFIAPSPILLGKLTVADFIMIIFHFLILSYAFVSFFYIQTAHVSFFIPWKRCKLIFHVSLKSTQANYLKLCGTISQTPAEPQNASSDINLETANEVGKISGIGATSVSEFNSSEW